MRREKYRIEHGQFGSEASLYHYSGGDDLLHEMLREQGYWMIKTISGTGTVQGWAGGARFRTKAAAQRALRLAILAEKEDV